MKKVLLLLISITASLSVKPAEQEEDINAKDGNGYTALNNAIVTFQWNTVEELLINEDLDINIPIPPYTYPDDHARRGGQTRPAFSPLLLVAKRAHDALLSSDGNYAGDNPRSLKIFESILSHPRIKLPSEEELAAFKAYYPPSDNSYVHFLLTQRIGEGKK